MNPFDNVGIRRLTTSELITAFSQTKCCEKYCMIGLLGMPTDSNTSGNYSLSCPTNFTGNGPTTTTVFGELVQDLRSSLSQLYDKPKEMISYLHQQFQNRFTKDAGSKDLNWMYMLDSTKRGPLTVCKKSYLAMYGITAANLDTAHKKIRNGNTSEASLPCDIDFTMKEAFDFFDLDLDAFKAENHRFVNFDGIEPTRRTLVFVAWFSDYLVTGGGEPEVSNIAFYC